MNLNELDDIERFYGGPRLTWTDFEKRKQLREYVAACQAQIEQLNRDPEKNKAALLREEVILEHAKQELERLEKHFLLI